MLIDSLILAISSSIDSLGIGITYGIKNTKIAFTGKCILFGMSWLISSISIYLGDFLKFVFPVPFINLIGGSILILIGIFILAQSFKSFKTKSYETDFDFDNSNLIDNKEALFLGIALSLDSFGIGVGASFIGISFIFFPLLIATFQFIFLSLGNFLGRKFYKISHLPNNFFAFISGFLLIVIGLIRIY